MENPRFRVSPALDGGAVILANAKMKSLLLELLADLNDRSVTETALMHALREVDAAAPVLHAGRASRAD